jgi:hypothetical protein
LKWGQDKVWYYVEKITLSCQSTWKSPTPKPQQEYVCNWMLLKKKLMHASKTKEDETKECQPGIKREAVLMARASKTMDNEADDILGDNNAAKGPMV